MNRELEFGREIYSRQMNESNIDDKVSDCLWEQLIKVVINLELCWVGEIVISDFTQLAEKEQSATYVSVNW